MRYLRYILLSFLTGILLTSCATPVLYYKKLDRMVSDGNYKEAAALAKSSKQTVYGDKNNLLYFIDCGILSHLSGNYADSNLFFEKAKSTAQEYFTKSITTEASTFLINDTMRPYYGEDFEHALIHVFSALNYISSGQEEEALVEARQVDHFLNTLQTNYGYKNVYKEDAFARYLAGMLYENHDEINDAFISYRKALDAYEAYQKSYSVAPPKQLIEDVIRTAQRLGFHDEIIEIEKKWKVPNENSKKISPSDGELVVIHYNGFSPVKVDDIFEISFGKGWAYVGQVTAKGKEAGQVKQASAIARSISADEQIRIAFPKYVPVEYKIQNAEITVDNLNKEFGPGELVQDIGKIAETDLQDRINRIRAKAIARAAVRYALSKQIIQKATSNQGKEGRNLVNLITKAALNTISTVIEHADTRSWRLLPDKIFMHRVILPEGIHSIQMKYYSDYRTIITTKNIDNINIKAGKKTYVIVRTAL